MKGVFTLLILCAVGVFTLGAAPATPQEIPELVGQTTLLGLPEIMGPKTVVVGELARLEVEGDKVAWDCVPTINDGQSFGDNNEKYVCSFRKKGLYTIIAAVAKDGDVKIMKFPIQVGTVDVEPEDPEEPEDPVKPVVSADPVLVKETVKWCESTSSDKAQCALVANVFDIVSGEIESEDLKSTAEIIERTAELNQDIEIGDLASLMGRIQAYLTQEADAGRLDSVEQHLVVWKSIAKGLTEYAKD
ncbi:MAG: hypothetical protein ACYSW8_31200 [Planctomycetota bacterium]|jgi:hypothetical protein